jgi:hypothetical protein
MVIRGSGLLFPFPPTSINHRYERGPNFVATAWLLSSANALNKVSEKAQHKAMFVHDSWEKFVSVISQFGFRSYCEDSTTVEIAILAEPSCRFCPCEM